MFLSTLDDWARITILAVAGLLIGALINFLIYRLCYFSKRGISPWMPRDESASPRKLLDYIPVLGWFSISREESVFGKAFWVRPLLIEAGWMIGLPLFYQWQLNGGLCGSAAWPAQWQMTWFYAHTTMIALMFVATFIDFDEQMIPDGVTVPGTIIALLFAALLPCFRLPNIPGNFNLFSSIAGNNSEFPLESLHFNSPHELPTFHLDATGLAIALSLFTFWVFATIPKRITFRHGIGGYFKYMLASITHRPRKTKCDLRVRPRQMYIETKIMGVIWIAGMILIAVAWKTLGETAWVSLFGSLLGLGFAGTMIWMVRIVAGYALGREAMGFGDVMLMFMLGAFLGWQASLMLFGLASLLGATCVLGYSVITGNNEFAYGPYLCGGALMTVLFWQQVWGYSQTNFFFMGAYILLVLLAALVLMALMLLAISWVRGPYEEDEEDEDDDHEPVH